MEEDAIAGAIGIDRLLSREMTHDDDSRPTNMPKNSKALPTEWKKNERPTSRDNKGTEAKSAVNSVCVCVCVFVCERDTARASKSQQERERERWFVSACLCLSVADNSKEENKTNL